MGFFNIFGEQEHRVFNYKPIYYDKEKEERKRMFGSVDGSLEKEKEKLEKARQKEQEKKEAEKKRKAERRKNKIESQLISTGGRLLRRGLLSILK